VPAGPDPLGKRALYWLPVDELAVPGDGSAKGPAGSGTGRSDPATRHARPAGKHALFSAATPAGEGESPDARSSDPLPPRGIFVITCSSCASVSQTGLIGFLVLQLPFGAWLPRRTFDRWMTCPACRRRTWTSVTLAR
jgi:hypothetical protein